MRVGASGTSLVVALMAVLWAHASTAQTPPSGYTETLRWYHQQADAGNPVAQFLLGIKYETGTDVPKDVARAAALFEMAARQGHADAQFKLASLLEAGRGVEMNRAAAETWYRTAALRGHAPAQYNLSLMLLSHAHSEDELVEGLSWLIRAARGGISPAEGLQARWRDVVSPDLMAKADRLSELPLDPVSAPR